MSYLEKVDKYLDSLKVGKSALVDSWFMMSSPTPILCVVLAYMLLIKVVPVLMKNRPPMQINNLIAYYNASQVLLASLICAKVTFLHVYHHVIMALYSWSYLKFAAGGEGAILALLNSMVHVFMYTYYLLSGFGPRFQKYLWWKKYVTTMQLIQFVMMLFYCAWTHFSPRCQYNSSFTYFISGNITIFLFLFLNFYSKSYKGKKDIKKEIKEEYNKTRNGIKTDDATKLINAVTQNGKKEENGFHRNNVNNTNGVGDNIKLKNSSEDYSKDGKMLLTRRTLNGTVEQQYDFGSVIKK
ncbi:unnamed protein product [Chilo suppressalis]|uniref:Elongation of very long chain fatty acids protein n=1 Tax=Chilo suppressalis TaxID=168631 RepID=A0ABN8BFP1_CHISP|nr:unnamed protein product [Chilo suppressalis]